MNVIIVLGLIALTFAYNDVWDGFAFWLIITFTAILDFARLKRNYRK